MSSYNKSKSEKRRGKVILEMESHRFNVLYNISTIEFSQTSKRSRTELAIKEGAETFLLRHFMIWNVRQDLMQRIED